MKADSGKVPLGLIDPYALTQIGWVLQFGAEKYGTHNWRAGIRYSRLIDASLRHLTAINAGENIDPETGLPHAAHLACCAIFLTWMMQFRTDMDDRWPAVDWATFGKADVQQAAAAPQAEDLIDDGVAEIARKFAPVKQEAPDAPAG
jgi:hypothetical protein